MAAYPDDSVFDRVGTECPEFQITSEDTTCNADCASILIPLWDTCHELLRGAQEYNSMQKLRLACDAPEDTDRNKLICNPTEMHRECKDNPPAGFDGSADAADLMEL